MKIGWIMKEFSKEQNIEIQVAKLATEASIEAIEDIYKELKESNLLNEQFVLDWLDKLNEISVRH